jgi:hypothetical protein
VARCHNDAAQCRRSYMAGELADKNRIQFF